MPSHSSSFRGSGRGSSCADQQSTASMRHRDDQEKKRNRKSADLVGIVTLLERHGRGRERVDARIRVVLVVCFVGGCSGSRRGISRSGGSGGSITASGMVVGHCREDEWNKSGARREKERREEKRREEKRREEKRREEKRREEKSEGKQASKNEVFSSFFFGRTRRTAVFFSIAFSSSSPSRLCVSTSFSLSGRQRSHELCARLRRALGGRGERGQGSANRPCRFFALSNKLFDDGADVVEICSLPSSSPPSLPRIAFACAPVAAAQQDCDALCATRRAGRGEGDEQRQRERREGRECQKQANDFDASTSSTSAPSTTTPAPAAPRHLARRRPRPPRLVPRLPAGRTRAGPAGGGDGGGSPLLRRRSRRGGVWQVGREVVLRPV